MHKETSNARSKKNTCDFSIASIADTIAPIMAKYPAIKQAWLFGSFARSEQTKASDLDFSLNLDSQYKFNLFDLSHLGIDLETAFGRECDIVTSKVKYKCVQDSIDKEKVLIYER